MEVQLEVKDRPFDEVPSGRERMSTSNTENNGLCLYNASKGKS